MLRTPIKVTRKPVIYLTLQGKKKSGGYMMFHKPDDDPPTLRSMIGHTSPNMRVLWCPYCGEWSVYEREHTLNSSGKPTYVQGSTARYVCQGCEWAHTEEYSVKMENNLWGNDTKK